MSPRKQNGRRIFIFGRNRLQNELLCRVVPKALASSTQVLDQLQALPRPGDGQSQRQLLLVDSEGTALKRIVDELADNQACTAAIVALFNLRRGTGVEQEAIRQGLRGFFYESDGLGLLLKGLKTLFEGEIWISRNVLVEAVVGRRGKKSGSAKEQSGLSDREMEILRLLATGANNRQIAERLSISEHTVKTHVYNIYGKINVPNRLQAALWMAHNG
jgi:DNA-binding NarL/FixJ family response regulator